MNVQEKIQRAKKALDFIATHDDDSVEDVSAALKEVAEHAKTLVTATVERRLGKFHQRLARYFARIVNALRGV